VSAVADILERAADLIEPEGKWTQEAEARDEDGLELEDYSSPGAVCWCAGGAIWKAASELGFVRIHQVQRYFEERLGAYAPEWNDALGRTQAEVVAKLREVAALARGEQP
jgi:hypothetical protein